MKNVILAGLIVMASAAAALANDADIPNSTNQHARDRVDFYGSVPDFRTVLSGQKPAARATERTVQNDHDLTTVVR